MKIISLHTGLNHVDPDKYDGWNGELRACLNDCAVEAALAARAGLKAVQMQDSQVTVAAMSMAYASAAAALEAGDVFYATHSGHGTELPVGEALVLWDGPLSDRERHNLLAAFRPGVTIMLVDDTCYSAGMISFAGSLLRTRGVRGLRPVRQVPVMPSIEITANLIQFAACRVTEESAEDDRHGYLTRARQEAFRPKLPWRHWMANAAEIVTQRNPPQHPVYYASNPTAEAILDLPVWTFHSI